MLAGYEDKETFYGHRVLEILYASQPDPLQPRDTPTN